MLTRRRSRLQSSARLRATRWSLPNLRPEATAQVVTDNVSITSEPPTTRQTIRYDFGDDTTAQSPRGRPNGTDYRPLDMRTLLAAIAELKTDLKTEIRTEIRVGNQAIHWRIDAIDRRNESSSPSTVEPTVRCLESEPRAHDPIVDSNLNPTDTRTHNDRPIISEVLAHKTTAVVCDKYIGSSHS